MPPRDAQPAKDATALQAARWRSPLAVSSLLGVLMLLLVFSWPRTSGWNVARSAKLTAPDQAAMARARHALAAVYPTLGGERLCAAREVLHRWRLFYKTEPVYLYNEGNDAALERLAAEFDVQHTYARSLSAGAMLIFDNLDNALAWMQRLIDAASTAQYVILLEDDVHILKPITMSTLKHDINGDNDGVSLTDECMQVIQHTCGRTPEDRHYGGFGGSIFSGTFLRKLGRSEWQHWVADLMAATQSTLFSDQMATSLMHCVGGTIGHYPGLVETWYEDYEARRAAGDVEVVHKDKSFYEGCQLGQPGTAT